MSMNGHNTVSRKRRILCESEERRKSRVSLSYPLFHGALFRDLSVPFIINFTMLKQLDMFSVVSARINHGHHRGSHPIQLQCPCSSILQQFPIHPSIL